MQEQKYIDKLRQYKFKKTNRPYVQELPNSKKLILAEINAKKLKPPVMRFFHDETGRTKRQALSAEPGLIQYEKTEEFLKDVRLQL